MNDPIKLLEINQEKYSELISELEQAVNDAVDLDLEILEDLEGELNSLEKVVYSIRIMTQNLTKQLFRYKAKNNKNALKEKKSLEFNEIMLFQGKSAKYLSNIENLAINGDVNAQYLIGRTYLQGIIGHYGELKMKDISLGLSWLLQAYNKGHFDAGYLIALHEKSLFNIKESLKILENLAENNHLKSLNELAIIYKDNKEYQNYEKLLKIQQKLILIE